MIRHAATAHLADCVAAVREDGQVDDRRYAEGALLVYERLGILSAEEAARWRERLADPAAGALDEAGRRWAADVRLGAERHVEQLSGPERRGAFEVLVAVGVLEEKGFSGGFGGGSYSAVDEDDAFPPEPEARAVRRVLVGSVQRHDGLALVALVIHEDAVALHFHQVREVADDGGSHEEYERMFSGLTPPALSDDAGRAYEAVTDHPVEAWSGGLAVGGSWLYTPTAGDDAQRFTAERGGHRWTLPGG